jgi:hypothetical protein
VAVIAANDDPVVDVIESRRVRVLLASARGGYVASLREAEHAQADAATHRIEADGRDAPCVFPQ